MSISSRARRAIVLPWLIGCWLLLSAGTISPQLGGGVSQYDGGISSPQSSSGPQQFFFAASGSDSNQCTQVSPCQTVTKANTIAAGSTVKFNGGDTFATTTGITSLVNVTSYGTGKATISSGNSSPCINKTNPTQTLSDTNIICTGGGNATNSTDGVLYTNNQAGATKLPGPTISGLTISGYGGNGILLKGTQGHSGFNGFTITGNTVHDVTGQVTSNTGFLGGTSCINVYNYAGFGGGQANINPSHTNGVISNNTVFNCTGVAGALSWTGSAITVFQAFNVLITGNIAHDYGQNVNFAGGGAGGIWGGDMDSVTMQFNEVYNGFHGVGGNDGNPYDLDEGTTNSVVQYNWGHDSMGNCVLWDANNDGLINQWGGNHTRFNICQRNGLATSPAAEINIAANGGDMTAPSYIYNNTIYPAPGSSAIRRAGSNIAMVNVFNNIFYPEQSGDTVISIPNPSSITFIGNDYFVPLKGVAGTLNFSWNGTSYGSFSAWQTATGQEKISGVNVGLTSDPKLYVPGGGFITAGYSPQKMQAYNLQAGSPMIGAGLNPTTQFGINPGAQDFYGNAVTASTLPVGAAKGDFTSFASSCTASTNFLARVSSFTKADNVNYDSLLCGLNSDGTLALIDVLYAPAAPNSAASLLNLLSSSFSLVAHGTTTFTARQGILGDGSTGYLDTQWTPSTNGVNFTQNSGIHSGCLLVNGLANTKADYGLQSLTVSAETASYTGAAGFFGDVNDLSGVFNSGITNSNGIPVMLRQGSTEGQAMNGSVPATATIASTAIPNQTLTLLANHKAAGPADFKAQRIACLMFGSGNIDPQIWTLRAQSFMQGYGISQY
jgi:hypothetical protein